MRERPASGDSAELDAPVVPRSARAFTATVVRTLRTIDDSVGAELKTLDHCVAARPIQTNFSRRVASASIRRSSMPWRQRLMFVVP